MLISLLRPLNLKPPAPLYPLQDFKALYKYCIIIIIIMVALCNTADHNIFMLFTVTLCNRADHYIFILFLSSSFFFFFLA